MDSSVAARSHVWPIIHSLEVHVRVWFSERREKNPLHELHSVILVFIPEAPTFIQHVNYIACEYVSHPGIWNGSILILPSSAE